ncbi:MAG: hypothetical protein ACFCUT_15525 [Kiloniellaceae bacterium]
MTGETPSPAGAEVYFISPHDGDTVSPRGEFLVEASEDKDELVTADMDMDKVREVRNLWQFFRDRRPETYGPLTQV